MSILDGFNEWSATEIMGWNHVWNKEQLDDWNPLEDLNQAVSVVREMKQFGPPVTITNTSMGMGFMLVKLEGGDDWGECSTPEEIARSVCYYTMNYVLNNQNIDGFPYKVWANY